jgi:hypothetical protein
MSRVFCARGAPSPNDLNDFENMARLSGEAKRSKADKRGFHRKDSFFLPAPENKVQGSCRKRE